jgi:CDP-diacylglycerol--glycerol-3-phosphate 3-phosphatidyltransferase
MTAATGLTILRLVAAPLFGVLLLRERAGALWGAAALFVLAAVTDKIDGWLARRTGTVTALGRALDPLADKLLVACALVAFVRLGVPGVEAWMVAAILGREVLVTALRSYAGRRGRPLPVSGLGKWKTTFQMAFVAAVLALMSLRAWMDPAPAYWKEPGDALQALVAFAFLVTTLLTIWSGLDYAWRTRSAFGRADGRGA